MSVIITTEGRKPLLVDDRLVAPATECADAFATMVAYADRYEFTGDKTRLFITWKSRRCRIRWGRTLCVPRSSMATG